MNSAFYFILALGAFSLTYSFDYQDLFTKISGSLNDPLSTIKYIDLFTECGMKMFTFFILCSAKVMDSWGINNSTDISKVSIKTICCSTWDMVDCVLENSK